ncbi:MAG: phage terminase large subunit family protein, partial [Betaproteobacteria bacterium]
MKHVILGAGPAGVIAAETIRKHAPHDSITLVGDEPEAPYSRMAIPYLLIGNIEESGTHLRHQADHFAQQRIDVLRGQRAVSVNTQAQTVKLSDGRVLPYDRLLVATGSRPASPPIPGINSAGVHACWTLDDARAIMALAKPGAKVVQMGAGFIGCIIMEALAMRGVQLSVVEMGDRMVPRMMGPTAGGMIKSWCERKGVKVYTGARVESIGAPGQTAPAAAAGAGSSSEPGLLSRIASAEPGRWITARAPYQRGIMDAISDPGVERVVFMKSAQVGATELLGNAVGYYIHQDPAPILLVAPTLEMARAWSMDRLTPMLRESPALHGKVVESSRRTSENQILHKSFPNGHLTIVGANSASGLASRPIRVVLLDEVDRYPASAGREGDPVTLATKRTATFHNRKVVMASTPTIKGASRIEEEWLRS